MNTKKKVLTLTLVCLLAAGAAGAAARGGGEGDIRADRRKFAGEWDEVMAKHPHVALAYLNALEAAAAGAACSKLPEAELSKVPALPQLIAAARAERGGAPSRLTPGVPRSKYVGIKDSLATCNKRCDTSHASCLDGGQTSTNCSNALSDCQLTCFNKHLLDMVNVDKSPGK